MQSDNNLEDFKIDMDTNIGWDANAKPNEFVDENGDVIYESGGYTIHDPRAPKHRKYDDPDVETLRQKLKANNGLKGIDFCQPHEVEKAVKTFRRDGFVVVLDLLTQIQLANFRSVASRVLKDILSIPGPNGRKYITETRRLPHRYSFGTASSSRQMFHEQIWADVVDLPTTTPILKAIFGEDDYLVWGGGGDLCLPGAIEYQHLHSDGLPILDYQDERMECASKMSKEISDVIKEKNATSFDELDIKTQRLVMDYTPPMVTINFLMSDLTWENGPIRQIPGSHTSIQQPPSPEDEPQWMRHSTLAGVPAGAGIIRDNRAWHGATPNLSKQVRAMPNIEYSPSWRPQNDFSKSMPYEVWEKLSPHAKNICRYIYSEKGVWPKGAGIMHPLEAKRFEASQS